ncbi:LL-diaminopimelate aminotransferase [Spirochaetia bacterium 38H-sp]|uniref:LL-diaminopimelate aminotransferase n=1 Tax=Rarispira pelagica TaxID=3141764 RepID=A0ABU9UBT7_9SPIR
MIKINSNYSKLKASYLFSTIAKKVSEYQKNNPDKKIIKMGIGDVTLPLPPACVAAFSSAVEEMGKADTFRGYGPEQGYEFLRKAIADNDFKARGMDIEPDEIFVSDGAKSDSANIQELFAEDVRVAIQDPVYPVYLDTNVMAGRSGEPADGRYDNITYLPCVPQNNFLPDIPAETVDLIYLCYPNNPTGAVADKTYLKKWVDYARENKSIIIFDAAYEAFITDENIPHSIYEIEGAKEVAIEIRSFSKTAGFTGTRCAYTVVPKECIIKDENKTEYSLNAMWFRRQSTKFNGVSYPVQRAAEAVYSEEGKKQVKENIAYYLENARILREALEGLGYECTGGKNSPYIWINTGKDSWEFFDMLLDKAQIVCTPGSGFGKAGEGFVRFSAFNSRENVIEAADRLKRLLG